MRWPEFAFSGGGEQARPHLSDEHFTVDGTLLEAWASQRSFRRKNQFLKETIPVSETLRAPQKTQTHEQSEKYFRFQNKGRQISTLLGLRI